jgi:uncharacterized protein YnzC (UPF0291/DUF896 family)
MRKTMKESVEYFRKNPARTGGIVLAFPHPAAINEVLINGPLRFRITREEFMEQLRKNKLRDNYISAVASTTGAKVQAEESTEMDESGEEFTHFYRAECI